MIYSQSLVSSSMENVSLSLSDHLHLILNIILFWIFLYCSVHIINFLLLKKSSNGGRDLTKLLDIAIRKEKYNPTENDSSINVNILLTAIITLGLMFFLKTNSYLITTPEAYLKSAEDTVLNKFFPGKNVSRYQTEL